MIFSDMLLKGTNFLLYFGNDVGICGSIQPVIRMRENRTVQ